MVFIIVWKVAGKLVNPKNITLGSYSKRTHRNLVDVG